MYNIIKWPFSSLIYPFKKVIFHRFFYVYRRVTWLFFTTSHPVLPGSAPEASQAFPAAPRGSSTATASWPPPVAVPPGLRRAGRCASRRAGAEGAAEAWRKRRIWCQVGNSWEIHWKWFQVGFCWRWFGRRIWRESDGKIMIIMCVYEVRMILKILARIERFFSRNLWLKCFFGCSWE